MTLFKFAQSWSGARDYSDTLIRLHSQTLTPNARAQALDNDALSRVEVRKNKIFFFDLQSPWTVICVPFSEAFPRKLKNQNTEIPSLLKGANIF